MVEGAALNFGFQTSGKFQKRNATSCDVRDVVVRLAAFRHRCFCGLRIRGRCASELADWLHR